MMARASRSSRPVVRSERPQPLAEPAPRARGLSADFRRWLEAHGYGGSDLGRDRLTGGSFGGRTHPDQKIERTPVVFVHGYGDRATIGCLPDSFERMPALPGTFGWFSSVEAFKRKGYTDAELYATTWGTGDPFFSGAFDRATVMHQRKFIEAVLEYTGSEKIHVIAHSAGVPLARRAIAGGWATDARGERYFIGEPLDAKVDTFLGICGANRGVPWAGFFPWLPVFCPRTGCYPGLSSPLGMSEFLRDLDREAPRVGDFVVSIWSGVDEVLGPGWVWGHPTSRIPRQDGEVVFWTAPYSHLLTRDLTGDLQHELVTKHGYSSLPPTAIVEGIPKTRKSPP
jgi:pimeloyl-ACP methyl ester carboxylesterase